MTLYREIQESLDYIETCLRTDLTAAELANRAGFSLYHYYCLFHEATGFPVMQYILRRRLVHAIYAIHNGKKRLMQHLLMDLRHTQGSTRLSCGSSVARPLYT